MYQNHVNFELIASFLKMWLHFMLAYPILAFHNSMAVISQITYFDDENITFKINFRVKYFQVWSSTVNPS